MLIVNVSDFIKAGFVLDPERRGREEALLTKTEPRFKWGGAGTQNLYQLEARFFRHPGGREWLEMTAHFAIRDSRSLVEVRRCYLDTDLLYSVSSVETFFSQLYRSSSEFIPLSEAT